jgi:signal peptidase II
VAALDQLTKLWALRYLSESGSIKVLGEFLMLTLVYNEGGALGTNLAPSLAYLIISIIIFGLVVFYIYGHRNSKFLSFPLSFIAGGALGNIIDRIRLGKVIDWIDVDFIDLNIFGYQLNRWWTFNIADAAISCSILFILAGLLFFKTTFADDDNRRSINSNHRSS